MKHNVETDNLEYKSDISVKNHSFKAEIVSFLNSNGGEIYLGVDDNGNILRELTEEKRKYWMELLTEWISNAFQPPVKDLISIYPNETPFRIKIKPGTNKPYYFTEGKGGLNIKGVYFRVGSSKKMATADEIIRMCMESNDYSHEDGKSPNQDLTFKYLESLLEKQSLTLNKHALFFYTPNNEFNIAALLFSDQNPITSKVGFYKSLHDYENLQTIKEFKGSICQQIDDIIHILNLNNKNEFEFAATAERLGSDDYPELALRESLINCFCHRDWSINDNIKISIFPDRIVMQSPGSLPQGLSLNDMLSGTCARRNEKIVNVLNKVKYIEAYGAGIKKILGSYKDYSQKITPHFNVDNKKFEITLYNINYFIANSIPGEEKDPINHIINVSSFERNAIVYHLLNKRYQFSYKQITEELDISLGTLFGILKTLNKQNLIDDRYKIIKENNFESSNKKIQNEILRYIHANSKISITKLIQLLNISYEILYKNIVELENLNLIEYRGKNVEFKIIKDPTEKLHNTSEINSETEELLKKHKTEAVEHKNRTTISRKQKILNYIQANNKITISILASHFNVSVATINRDLKDLKESGALTFCGSPRNGYWKVNEIID